MVWPKYQEIEMRAKNIGVVTVGYSIYAFEDANEALQLMAILSKAISVENQSYGMGESPHEYFMAESAGIPELKFVPQHKFNTMETVKEAKERMAREKADREDIDQQFRTAPEALPPPAPTADDGVFF